MTVQLELTRSSSMMSGMLVEPLEPGLQVECSDGVTLSADKFASYYDMLLT